MHGRVRVALNVAPKSFTSITGSMMAVPTLKCVILSIGRIEVYDFSLFGLHLRSSGIFQRITSSIIIIILKFI